MGTMAGLPIQEFRKENRRKIGDRGLFATNPQHKYQYLHQKHSGDEAYVKFLKEEQALRYRRMKKADHQRVALVTVYCSLPVLLFLIGYWWFGT